MFNACFVDSWGQLSWHSLMKILELTTSWCSLLQTVQTDVLATQACFLLLAFINWSHSSLYIPAVGVTVNWRSSTWIWIYSHPIACCLLFFGFLLYGRCVNVSFAVTALPASLETKCCLYCRYVPLTDALKEASIVPLNPDLLSPGWRVSVAMIRYCAIEEADENEEKLEVLRSI